MASVVGSAGKSFFSRVEGGATDETDRQELQEGPIKCRKAIASLSASYALNEPNPKLLNYIDGEYKDPSNYEWINVVDPGTGEVSCRVGRGSKTDVDMAVASAKAAYPQWSATPPAVRAGLLCKIADGIRSRLEELARLESCDVGKPLRLARAVDIPRAAENFEFFARMITVDETAAHAMPDAVNITQRTPVGVAALITPWNLPLYLLTWKVAPALACGNTVVIKPSELTPLTACALSEIVAAAGVPKGVVNIVHGYGHEAGAPMVSHPDVRLVSFTGGTATGRIVASSAAATFKKTSLELGGKNPAVVFADCDLDKTAEGVARGFCLNSGQVCLCCPRILVERSIFEVFRDKLIEIAKRVKVGDPLRSDTTNGPVISKLHWEKISSYVDLARTEGATIHCGGGCPAGISDEPRIQNGFYFQPTVITGLAHSSRVAQEEIFGPVCTLHPFDTEEQAITLANDVPYGLAASVWTENGSKALRVSHAIETGMVWVNCWMHRDLRVPFGGVKESGLGHEGGTLSLDFYSETKNICLKMS